MTGPDSVCTTFAMNTPKCNITVEIVYNDIGYNDEPDITTEL